MDPNTNGLNYGRIPFDLKFRFEKIPEIFSYGISAKEDNFAGYTEIFENFSQRISVPV